MPGLSTNAFMVGLCLVLVACPVTPDCSEPSADGGYPAECSNHGTTGDVGQSCTPGGDSCANVCLQLQSGDGVCIDTCGPQGRVDCPDGYKCNTRPKDDGTTVDVCLPNASCGDLTYQGYCDGAQLHYCATEGAVTVDCAGATGQNGQPMQCAVVNPAIGSNCVSSVFNSGCGAETEEGRCDGNTLVFCESVASGNIIRQDCSGADVCSTSNGRAACLPPNVSGCGDITYQGYCESNTVVYCLNNAVTRLDCTNGTACAFVDNDVGYNCVQPTSGTGTNRVRGRFVFDKRALTTGGLGNTSQQPVRQAIVRVLASSDNHALASGYTGADGRFDLSFDGTGQVYVAVFAAADNDQFAVAVRDCPLDDCGGVGNVYGIASQAFNAAPDTDLGDQRISETSGMAGAFNIFDVFTVGQAFATANYGRRPPPLTVQWKAGSNTRCNTSCFSSRSTTIYILSTSSDTDEFDDPVLLHEFGHYMERSFSRSDSPGGSHDGSPTDPLLAWGEGYGTWVGCAISNSPLYIDSRAAGAGVIDVNNTGVSANIGGGMRQLLSEYVVSEALWHLSKGGAGAQAQGTAPVFDVLASYFPTNALVDRGVAGVDFVDFWDGWFCRGHGAQTAVQSVLSGVQFPYDFAGPSSCQ